MAEADCTHERSIPAELARSLAALPHAPILQDLSHIWHQRFRYLDSEFHSVIEGLSSSDKLESLDTCREELREIYKTLTETNSQSDLGQAYDASDLDAERGDGGETLVTRIAACIEYLARVPRRQMGRAADGSRVPLLPTLSVAEEHWPLLRDALLVYCSLRIATTPASVGSHARITISREAPSWESDRLWYLFFLNFWDEGSEVCSSRQARGQIYRDLFLSHLDPTDITIKDNEFAINRAILRTPRGCFTKVLSRLAEINPVAFWEALRDLNDYVVIDLWCSDHEREEALLTEPDVDYWSEFERSLGALARALAPPPARLLLCCCEPLANYTRTFAASLMPKLAIVPDDFVRLSRLTLRGRAGVQVTDKARHYRQALDQLELIQTDLSAPLFQQQTPHSADLRPPLAPVWTEINNTIRSAISSLALPLDAVEAVARRQFFYFALFIDHENLWGALRSTIQKTRPDLAARKDSFVNGTWVQQRTTIFTNDYHLFPAWYKPELEELMTWIVKRILLACERHCGVPEFDYCKAIADWDNQSYAHKLVYKNLGIETDEPDMTAPQKSQASDHKIAYEIATVVRERAALYHRRPFCVVLSGDGGFGQPLRELHKEGGEFQFWLLKGQPQRRFLQELDSSHKIYLDEFIELDRFNWTTNPSTRSTT